MHLCLILFSKYYTLIYILNCLEISIGSLQLFIYVIEYCYSFSIASCIFIYSVAIFP